MESYGNLSLESQIPDLLCQILLSEVLISFGFYLFKYYWLWC